MTEDAKLYGWTILFYNDRQGFARTIRVEGQHDVFAAIEAGLDQLLEMYAEKAEDFTAIKAERGRQVGT